MTIALLEDNDQFAAELEAAIQGHGTRLVRFSPPKDPDADDRPADLILEKWLRVTKPFPDLLVTDRDLTEIKKLRLSTSAALEAARRVGVPICLYARNLAEQDQREMNRLGKWSDGFIALDGQQSPEGIARQILGVLGGFSQLRADLKKVGARAKKKDRATPATTVAEMLGEKALASRLALYMTGDSDKLTDVLTRADIPSTHTGTAYSELRRRVPIAIGSWLWESVLRYPGVFVNDIAAASYLNIAVADFQKDSVQKYFSAAKYCGPFSGIQPRWYRHKLDELIDGSKDGRDFLKQRHGIVVKSCACSLNSKIPAGYLCILSNRPVSKENSIGGIAWIPSGADLARVSKDIYDELSVWLGF